MHCPPASNTLALALLLALAACQQSATPAGLPTEASASASAQPPAPPAPAPAPTAAARKVNEKTDLYEFTYSYPAAAAAIPALRDWLEADLARTKAGLASDAGEARKDAKAEGFPFNAYTASSQWQVVTDLPGWLSLSTLVGSYTGGAHPNYGFDTILWDKAANQKRTATDLFASKAALKAAVLKAFCVQLQRERAKKRAGEEVGDPVGEFNKCIDPTDQTVILGSKGHTGFDRIGFLISPYAAGPYAEGSYEVTLPVTAAVVAAAKPEYKAAFVAQ
ncbi:PdaC/SigV domain-containing protein [Novosphingobium sp.]|uniref:PdaC/SigV domain-containing protein n=1 Tax=Novosphingobium sp. TaxID=1874826 RepID=UPI003BAA5B6B